MIFTGIKIVIEPCRELGLQDVHSLQVTILRSDGQEYRYSHLYPEDFLRSRFDYCFDFCKEEIRKALEDGELGGEK
jgi:hypothetical protein